MHAGSNFHYFQAAAIRHRRLISFVPIVLKIVILTLIIILRVVLS